MTTTKKLLALSLALSMNFANASTVAIVDSGNDFLHPDLVQKTWINPLEIASNDRDEDRNGYPDDVNGWNFAETNNVLIDYSYAYSYTEDAKMFFAIQLKSFMGTVTQADRDWVKEKFKDEKFIKTLQIFGNWMHGTHVTGIAAKNTTDAKFMGIKLIPTEVKLPGKSLVSKLVVKTGNSEASFQFNPNADKGAKETIIKAAITALAKQSAVTFVEIGSYMNTAKVDVMNGSFGTSYEAIQGVLGQLYETLFKKKATDAELKGFADTYFATALVETRKFLASAPNTLFVFAAGNDGSNNDIYPTTPTNVVGDNKISVAATLNDQGLANFSNYGVVNVEVAAPGVGINSTIPMNHYLAISGTSQAAPYVANVAALVKDANPKLTAVEIKKIIMDTVDVKSWLIGKVKTGGMVNSARAVRAAEISRKSDLVKAIAQSKIDILAKTENESLSSKRYNQIPKEWVMPLPSLISVK